MPDNIIHIDEAAIKGQVSELVRGTVEETLNQSKRTNKRTCTKRKAPAIRSSFGVYSFNSALIWYRV